MEQEKAYSIIDKLANGIDPTTGEIFPDDSPYNHPDIIRALFYVLRNQIATKKTKSPKKTIEEKQQENLERNLPKNYGLPWTEEAIELVISQYQVNVNIVDIANIVERKTSSIIGVLLKKSIIDEAQAMQLGQFYK